MLIPPHHIRGICKYGEVVKLMVEDSSFQKFFSHERSHFIMSSKFCQLFSSKWQAHLVSFCDLVIETARYSSVSNHLSFFHVQMVFNKMTSVAHNSVSHLLCLENRLTLACCSALCIVSILKETLKDKSFCKWLKLFIRLPN